MGAALTLPLIEVKIGFPAAKMRFCLLSWTINRSNANASKRGMKFVLQIIGFYFLDMDPKKSFLIATSVPSVFEELSKVANHA